MPIHAYTDNIKKLCLFDGAEFCQIGRVYDNNGCEPTLINSAEETVFPGYSFTKCGNFQDKIEITDSRLYVHATPSSNRSQCTSFLVYTLVDFTGYDTLTIEWKCARSAGYGYLGIGYTITNGGEASFSTVTVSNANLGQSRPAVTGELIGSGGDGKTGTLVQDISGLSGVYEVGIAAVSRTTAGGYWIGGEIDSIMLT